MSSQSNKKIVLVDGSSYLFRAYHALPPLTNSKGQATGAIYGVVNMLNKLIKDEKPDYIGVVFDTKGTTFREVLYPAYKAHRPEMHMDLASQIQPLHDVIKAMGLPLIAIEGVEADDVIGTLVKNAEMKGYSILISTGDKDFAQLVDPHVKLVNTMTGSLLDEAAVETKFGIPPSKIRDYLALVGDSVDNIPGVPNVGPKTAVKWLLEHGSLDNIIAQADHFKGKVGENLRASLSFLPLSHQLVTIKQDVPLDFETEDLKPTVPDNDKLYALYSELEFKTWLKALNMNKAVPIIEAITIDTCAELEKLIKAIHSFKVFSFSINLENTFLQSLTIAFEADALYCIKAQSLKELEMVSLLKSLFEESDSIKVGYNLKQAINILSEYDISLKGPLRDVMLESYVHNSTSTRHGLADLVAFYLKVGDFIDSQTALYILKLNSVLWPQLESTPSIKTLYETLEAPLVPVLAKMEKIGVKIDAQRLNAHSQSLKERIDAIEQKVSTLAGETINLSSPKQLGELFYTKLGLPILAKTPKGQPSTSESVLKALSLSYEIPALILDHRSLIKLKTTYTDKLPLLIDSKTGRIHTSYQQAITATGRLSSTDPNLQNIPIKTAEGRKVRKAFIAEKDYVLIAADYSQVELRIMAHLSQDASLIEAFNTNQDIHQFTASEIFNTELTAVSSEQRRAAKAINFGLIYGMSSFGLSEQLGIDRKEAEAYRQLYFKRYPGVKIYMEQTKASAFEKGFVETLFGRRLYLPEIQSKNVMQKRAAERIAINAPLQGSAADIIKLAMIQIQKWIEHNQHSDKIKMIMQVHDELVFEVREDFIENAQCAIIEAMETTVILSIPLSVSVGVGNNWDDAH